MQDMSRMLCHRYAGDVDRIEELRYLVLAAQREGNRRLTEALRPLGVTPAQAEVLTVLAGSDEPLSVKELGTLLVCETGSPSRLPQTVVAAGWADQVRDEADGRLTRLRLTPSGTELARGVAEVEASFHAQLRAALQADEDTERTVAVLRTLVADGPAGAATARRRARAAARRALDAAPAAGSSNHGRTDGRAGARR